MDIAYTMEGRKENADVRPHDMTCNSCHLIKVTFVILAVILGSVHPTDATQFDVIQNLKSYVPDSLSTTLGQWDVFGFKPGNFSSSVKTNSFRTDKEGRNRELLNDERNTRRGHNKFDSSIRKPVKMKLSNEASRGAGSEKFSTKLKRQNLVQEFKISDKSSFTDLSQDFKTKGTNRRKVKINLDSLEDSSPSQINPTNNVIPTEIDTGILPMTLKEFIDLPELIEELRNIEEPHTHGHFRDSKPQTDQDVEPPTLLKQVKIKDSSSLSPGKSAPGVDDAGTAGEPSSELPSPKIHVALKTRAKPTTMSPLTSDYSTTPLDDNMYEVTTEGIEDWEEMLKRINTEDDNDDNSREILSRLRRGGAALSTPPPEDCQCQNGGYCLSDGSCNCDSGFQGTYCETPLDAAATTSSFVTVEAEMSDSLTVDDRPALTEQLNTEYDSLDGFSRVFIERLLYNATSGTTKVLYKIVSNTPIDGDDVNTLASLSRNIIQSGLEVDIGTKITHFIPTIGFLNFREVENTTTPQRVPLVNGSAGTENINDICFLFNTRGDCQNGGQCVPVNGKATCSCVSGWLGEYCQWPQTLTEDPTGDFLTVILPVILGALAGMLLVSCCCFFLCRRTNRGESESSTLSVPRSFLVIPGPFFTRSNQQEWKQFYPGPRSVEEREPPLHRDESSRASTSGNTERSWRSHESMNYPDYQIPRPAWDREKNDLFF